MRADTFIRARRPRSRPDQGRPATRRRGSRRRSRCPSSPWPVITHDRAARRKRRGGSPRGRPRSTARRRRPSRAARSLQAARISLVGDGDRPSDVRIARTSRRGTGSPIRIADATSSAAARASDRDRCAASHRAPRNPTASRVLPPPPYGSSRRRGRRRAPRRSRTTAVFWPSIRFGLTRVDEHVPCRGRPSSRAAASASSNVPSNLEHPGADAPAPVPASPSATAPAGCSTTRRDPRAGRIGGRRRSRVPGRGADHRLRALLDRLGDGDRHAAVLEATGRVGRLDFSHSSTPRRAERRGARISGVEPSPSETTGVASLDRKPVAEPLDQTARSMPSRAPRRRARDDGQRDRLASRLGQRADRRERRLDASRGRLVRDDVQRPRGRCPAAARAAPPRRSSAASAWATARARRRGPRPRAGGRTARQVAGRQLLSVARPGRSAGSRCPSCR